jgi:hypothetical protein
MNWRRGLLRLWLLASLAWVAFNAFAFSVPRSLSDAIGWGLPEPPPGYVLDAVTAGWANLRGFLLFGLGMPALALALGFAAAWVARGFKP